MDILGIDNHHEVKRDVDSDDDDEETMEMEMPTTVTIVEEDGTTSVVDDASVSSIVTDAGPNSSIQFGQSSNGGVTYRVVGIADEQQTYQPQPTVQVLSPAVNGQYYVINQDMLGRPISGRSQILDARNLSRFGLGKVSARDDKKRATHNEVERRRRDKINGWISKLAKIVPTCLDESTNKGQSKGGILAKACEYITELKTTNCKLAATLKDHEGTASELDTLRREINELRKENMMLKQQLGPTEEESTVIISTTE